MQIREWRAEDRPQAGTLLDETVGAGFHDLGAADARLSLVAEDASGLTGVIAAAPAAYEELRDFYAVPARLPAFGLTPAPRRAAATATPLSG
jgi:hypothetical protein